MTALLSNIVFDYLDETEGVIVQPIHTAKSSDNIHLLGRVKGSGYAVRREFGPHPTLARIAERIFNPLFFSSPLASSATSLRGVVCMIIRF